MRYLIISDIHGNLEAFEKIINQCDKLNVDEILCLGDIVGYGANPHECLMLAKKHCTHFINGNHEYALFAIEYQQHFNTFAYDAIDWTREQLGKRDLDFIKTFTFMKIFDEFTLVHGSPHNPKEFYYISSSYEADTAFRHFKTRLCFIGHTHVPQLFTEGHAHSSYLKPGTVYLNRDKRYIINVGSIGQPRDFDKRLSCAVFDDSDYSINLVRIPYDNRKAAEKIHKAGLPAYLAQRLL